MKSHPRERTEYYIFILNGVQRKSKYYSMKITSIDHYYYYILFVHVMRICHSFFQSTLNQSSLMLVFFQKSEKHLLHLQH